MGGEISLEIAIVHVAIYAAVMAASTLCMMILLSWQDMAELRSLPQRFFFGRCDGSLPCLSSLLAGGGL